MDQPTHSIPVTLPNGARIRVEATNLDAEGVPEGVAFPAAKFEGVASAIDGIASAVQAALEKARPTKASVELGLELALESGALTALLVKGSGKANLKIILQWGS